MTGEHVFPDWINGVYPSDDVGDTNVLQRVVDTDELVTDRVYTKKDVASLRTRFVCAKCNNGWMGQLEQEAEPLITALAKGGRRTLGPAEQLVLATWAVKTFQVCETTFGHQFVASQSDREIVMTQGRPPAHVRVWALAYQGRIGPLRSTIVVALINEAGQPTAGRAYLGTIQVGCLVLQVGGADLGISTGAGIERYGSVTGLRLQLYPPIGSITWPPAEILDDESFLSATTDSSVINPRIPAVAVPNLRQLVEPPPY